MSPVWAIWIFSGATASSRKISTWRGPVFEAGREWAMIGAPVCRLARDAARWIFSMFSFTPGSSAAHLMNAALMSVPWIPSWMSWTKQLAMKSASRFIRYCGSAS